MKNQSILLKNAKIYTPDKVLTNGWILVNSEGQIEKVEAGEVEILDHVNVIDVKGRSILPGFIDIHIHGGNGYSVMDGTYEALAGISSFHAQHGTTSFLATTTTDSNERIVHALKCVSDSMKMELPGADIIGIHLEGPFINEVRSGAQDKAEIRPPSIKEISEFLQASNDQIKLVTMAPEVKNGFEAVKYFHDNGVTVSIGHSDATFQQVKEALNKGASHTTHHFNGMRPIHHREPGVAGAGLILSDITSEIITDGVHVHPMMVKLLFETKGVWNICAITDAVSCAGLPDGDYGDVFVTNGEVYLSDGSSLAGSTLTMIKALKNVLEFTGYTIEDVLPSFTLVPARQAGVEAQKGSIEIGKNADLLIVDEELTIFSTYVKGKEVYKRSGEVVEM
jgi:N-acetylglucosamine-6-phosphate deacetylase